jgi:uridine kinase
MQLTAALLDLCKGSSKSVIAIDGHAGAGKTTLATNLALALSQDLKVQVIHMDDLYDGWHNALGPQLSETLTHIVSAHKSGKKVKFSTYDWIQSQFNEAKEIPEADLIILEGVGSGQLAIRDELAALLWIDIDHSLGLERVISRDGDSIEAQMQKWLVQQEQHFAREGTQNAADFILTT